MRTAETTALYYECLIASPWVLREHVQSWDNENRRKNKGLVEKEDFLFNQILDFHEFETNSRFIYKNIMSNKLEVMDYNIS